jgi:predicted DNA-binding transcriptional regulator YafY
MESNKTLRFIYRNYRQSVETRRVLPDSLRFGQTPYHPRSQWLLRAWDLDRKDWREFAVEDVLRFVGDCEDDHELKDDAEAGKGAAESK